MRCAVIGSPVAHSLSPVLHRAAYDWLGLDWTYERHETGAEQVTAFVAGLGPDWRGLSATMPCKRAILALGVGDEVVTALGVANTVIFDGAPGVRATTRIRNTDVTGLRFLLAGVGLEYGAGVQIFGNGATARSALFALAGLGVGRAWVRARDDAKTASLAADAAAWGIEVVPGTGPADWLVSTVPGAVGAAWFAPVTGLSFVFDIVYDPWPTPLATAAAARGLTTLTGLDLLAAQAVGQVGLMTGRGVPFELLREAAERGMVARRAG